MEYRIASVCYKSNTTLTNDYNYNTTHLMVNSETYSLV